jgi:hypothetical protein
MLRNFRTSLSVAVGCGIALGLSACVTPANPEVDAPVPALTNPATTGGAPSSLPSCDEIATVIGVLASGLSYNADVSTSQTAEEAYDQRVCVFTSSDSLTQLGVTIAAIAFQQAELDGYATLPNSISDDRLTVNGAVLQTFLVEDGPADHLDSPLYLFDTKYSITVQGESTSGSTVSTLPALTVSAAADAAFAVRALID